MEPVSEQLREGPRAHSHAKGPAPRPPHPGVQTRSHGSQPLSPRTVVSKSHPAPACGHHLAGPSSPAKLSPLPSQAVSCLQPPVVGGRGMPQRPETVKSKPSLAHTVARSHMGPLSLETWAVLTDMCRTYDPHTNVENRMGKRMQNISIVCIGYVLR